MVPAVDPFLFLMVYFFTFRLPVLTVEEGCKKGGLCLGDAEEERQKWEDTCDADMLDISADKIKEIMEDLEEQLMELERELSDASSLY